MITEEHEMAEIKDTPGSAVAGFCMIALIAWGAYALVPGIGKALFAKGSVEVTLVSGEIIVYPEAEVKWFGGDTFIYPADGGRIRYAEYAVVSVRRMNQ